MNCFYLDDKELSLVKEIMEGYQFTGNGARCAKFSEIWIGIMQELNNPTKQEVSGNGAPVHRGLPDKAHT